MVCGSCGTLLLTPLECHNSHKHSRCHLTSSMHELGCNFKHKIAKYNLSSNYKEHIIQAQSRFVLTPTFEIQLLQAKYLSFSSISSLYNRQCVLKQIDSKKSVIYVVFFLVAEGTVNVYPAADQYISSTDSASSSSKKRSLKNEQRTFFNVLSRLMNLIDKKVSSSEVCIQRVKIILKYCLQLCFYAFEMLLFAQIYNIIQMINVDIQPQMFLCIFASQMTIGVRCTKNVANQYLV